MLKSLTYKVRINNRYVKGLFDKQKFGDVKSAMDAAKVAWKRTSICNHVEVWGFAEYSDDDPIAVLTKKTKWLQCRITELGFLQAA